MITKQFESKVFTSKSIEEQITVNFYAGGICSTVAWWLKNKMSLSATEMGTFLNNYLEDFV